MDAVTRDRPAEPIKVKPTKKAKEAIMTTDKLSDIVFSNKLTNNQQGKVSISSKKPDVKTQVMLNYDELARAGVTGTQWLNRYDRAILDAIHSLHYAGNDYITIDQIYRLIAGKTEAERPSKKQAEAINRAIDHLKYTKITIDATAEAKAGYKKLAEFVYDDPALIASRCTVSINGQTTTALHFKQSILLDYAEAKNQIARVPVAMLATPNRKDENSIPLRDYLLRRINAMQGRSKLSNIIKLDKLLADLNYTDLLLTGEALTAKAKVKRKRVVDQIKTQLDYWQQQGKISGYQVQGKRPVKSFKIFF